MTFTDKDGTKDDVYVVPSTAGVEYLVGGKVVAAGTYPGVGTVTVTACAIADYVLATGATASWSGWFKATPFVVTPAAVTFPDQAGTKDDVVLSPPRLVLGVWSVARLLLRGRIRVSGW